VLNLKCKRFSLRKLYFFSRPSKWRSLLKDRTEVNFPVNEPVLKQLDCDEDLPLKAVALRALGAGNRVMI